jgi:hypothetical protein
MYILQHFHEKYSYRKPDIRKKRSVLVCTQERWVQVPDTFPTFLRFIDMMMKEFFDPLSLTESFP